MDNTVPRLLEGQGEQRGMLCVTRIQCFGVLTGKLVCGLTAASRLTTKNATTKV
jgi:hypothetical protein